MKRIIFVIIIAFLCSMRIGHAQEVQYEEHKLRIIVDTIVCKQEIESILASDSLLGLWITSIRPSFPFSQDEMLQRVYYLNYTCSREQIESRLSVFSWITQIMPIEIVPENMLYTPSDLFWKVTKTTDPTYLWHLTKIEAEKAWNITKGSPDVKIAVLDRIIDGTHPDLQGQLVYNYDPYTPSIKMEFDGTNTHGTTVASFVAASTDDPENSPAKLASIGFNCKIVGYYQQNFLEKIHHAAFVEKVSVIVSCAGEGIRSRPQNEEIEKKVVKEILDHGTIIVAPAGNGKGTHNEENGKQIPFYPFHPKYDDRIIIVSSTDINDNHTYIRNGEDCTHSHFEEVTVCAPGYAMMGAYPGNPDYPYLKNCSGTSYATPIVAGLCGLMKSVFPDLTPAKAKEILISTADPIKDADLYPNMVGAGRINAYKAVLATKQYAETCQVSYKNQTISGSVNKEACTLKMENTVIKKGASVTFTIDTDAELGEGFSVEEGATFEIKTK